MTNLCPLRTVGEAWSTALCLVLLLAAAARGEATVATIGPPTLAAGGTARLSVAGAGLSGRLRLVAEPAIGTVAVDDVAADGTAAKATLVLPGDALGPLRISPATADGPAAARMLVIDDLPAVAATASTRESPQGLTLPVCVDGTCRAGQADCFRFGVTAGQRIAVEVVTRQIGSPMDPFVRLLDASGRVLASADDGPTGPECRLEHVFAAAGDAVLEVRHSAHQGGMAYHLRIGDFPIVSHAVPLAVRPGTSTQVSFAGSNAAAVEPVAVEVPSDFAGGGRYVAARLPGGRSAAWVPVVVHDAPQLVEPPENEIVPLPVGISGRLGKPGERDAYRLRIRTGETIRFVSRGRSLGCGTVPHLRLLDAAGKLVAESAVTESDEPELAFTATADGEYRLEVEDLAHRGGADYGYFVAIEPAAVAVAVKPDPKTRLMFAVEPGQGAAPIDLVVKRHGYDGPVTVALAHDVPGLRIVNPLVPEKATEARIYVAADANYSPESFAVVKLTARAGERPPVPVSTTAVRAVQDKVVCFPGPIGDGGIVVAGVAAGGPRFALAPTAPVELVRTGTAHRITLAVSSRAADFKGPIMVVGPLVPRGFSVTSVMDQETCVVSLVGGVQGGEEPAVLRLLAVSDVGARTTLTPIELPVTWTGPPPTPSPVPQGPGGRPPAFAADYAAAVERLKPRVSGSLATSVAGLAVKGAVRLGAEEFATFTAGRLDGGPPPLGSAWSVSLWYVNRLANDARPVTAYLFSRGVDGDHSGGDHLGIGGTYRPDMPGRLFVFNGNARNALVLGRSVIPPREWHHVVLVRDAARVRVYLDGGVQPEIDAEMEAVAAGAGGYFFGARSDDFAALEGAIAHVAVFDRALEPAEARGLFTAATPAVTPQPEAAKNGDSVVTGALDGASQPQGAPAAVPASSASGGPAATAAADPPVSEPAQPQPPAAVAPLRPGLHVFPAAIDLDGARDRQQISVTTVDAAGFPCDRTRRATISVTNPDVARLRGTTILPVGDGLTEAVIEADGLRMQIPVTVKHAAVARPVRFEGEVMAALSKQTCSSGACHGSPSGKGGFRLSLRASDRQLDELTLVREEFGRRVNPIEPDASLLLRKPLMQVPHGGGRHLVLDDESHRIIRAWIAEGARPDPPQPPRCVRLEVSPAGRQVQRLSEGGRQIVAIAHDSDGTRRDVSHLAAYESSAPAVATVDAGGWVEPRKRGEAVILVRYLDRIELVPLMFIEQTPGFVWRAAPAVDEIDRLVDEKLRDLQYPPSPLCGDAEFVRRVHLDLVGLLPTVAETEAFLADTAADKRAKLVDRLLEREDHARYWALKWGDILRLTRKLTGDQGVFKYHRWLEDSFRTNKPHDQFARELLLGSGSSFGNPPANFYRTTADVNETAETVAQLFLGVRLQCAKCHNHPFDRWSQDDYYGLGAFFERVRKRKTPVADETFVYVASSGETKQPRSGAIVKPSLPRVGPVELPPDADRREAFVAWLLAHDNPFFARVEANRVWSQFFARGIVHPVDEFRDSNPPSNQPLLDRLAADFAAGGFDRRRLIRTILRSRTYQTTSTATAENRDDTVYFSHQLPRLLSAEQLLDAIDQVTGVEQNFGPLPAGTRATQLPAPDVARVDFLRMFGQPERGTVCACERADDSSLGMAIELVNGTVVNTRLSDPQARFRREIAAGRPVEAVIRDLYLAALCREPTPEEMAAAVAQAAGAKDPANGVADVCWALFNCDEFVFQH